MSEPANKTDDTKVAKKKTPDMAEWHPMTLREAAEAMYGYTIVEEQHKPTGAPTTDL